jgi:hypothetical protein
MRLLLDENLPHDFRHHLTGHDAFTVAYMGWAGTKNGDLLRLAAGAGFEAMLTMERRGLSAEPRGIATWRRDSRRDQ